MFQFLVPKTFRIRLVYRKVGRNPAFNVQVQNFSHQRYPLSLSFAIRDSWGPKSTGIVKSTDMKHLAKNKGTIGNWWISVACSRVFCEHMVYLASKRKLFPDPSSYPKWHQHSSHVLIRVSDPICVFSHFLAAMDLWKERRPSWIDSEHFGKCVFILEMTSIQSVQQLMCTRSFVMMILLGRKSSE